MKKVIYPVSEISSIQDMLLKSAAAYGNKLALSDFTDNPLSRVTYVELLETVQKFGSALFKLGLKERSRVAIISENRVQWAVSYLTLMCFNMVAVPIDSKLTSNEIINILHESEAEAIIFSDSFDQLFRYEKPVLKKLSIYISMDLKEQRDGIYSFTELLNDSSAFDISKLPVINSNEMCEIIFTSGSVGRSKGVMLTQKNLSANLMAMTSLIKITENDIFLSVLPIHHKYECTCGLLCPVYSGCTVYYARSLKTVTDDLQKSKATILLGVPLLFEKMFKRIYKTINEDKVKSKIVPAAIKLSKFAEMIGWKSFKKVVFKELHGKFGGHIRLFIAGGAAPDPQIAKGLRDLGFFFVQGYGLTETSPILALNQIQNFKDNAAGLPLPGIEIKISNPDSEGIGEILAKGNNVMLGYYKNEELTKESFNDGYFKTGDLGMFDSDGFLHICGRKKNIIIANNGKNIFPEEIEDVLNRHPLVLESFVYGEKDSKHDEVIAAQIVFDSEAIIEYSEKNKVEITKELLDKLLNDIIKESNKELAIHKQIKKCYLREREFEKTTTQKIKRYLINNEGVVTSEQ